MKKTYKIDVDCANCANKMEDAARKTPGVKDANVNFMTLKMAVEFDEGQDPKAVMAEVLKNCKKVESDCGDLPGRSHGTLVRPVPTAGKKHLRHCPGVFAAVIYERLSIYLIIKLPAPTGSKKGFPL